MWWEILRRSAELSFTFSLGPKKQSVDISIRRCNRGDRSLSKHWGFATPKMRARVVSAALSCRAVRAYSLSPWIQHGCLLTLALEVHTCDHKTHIPRLTRTLAEAVTFLWLCLHTGQSAFLAFLKLSPSTRVAATLVSELFFSSPSDCFRKDTAFWGPDQDMSLDCSLWNKALYFSPDTCPHLDR